MHSLPQISQSLNNTQPWHGHCTFPPLYCPPFKEEVMKYPHLKILMICVLAFGFCYAGWVLLFGDPVSPEKTPQMSYAASTAEEPPSTAPVPSSTRYVFSRRECEGIAAIAAYSILLPCIEEHNRPISHKAHATGRPTAHPLTNPSH